MLSRIWLINAILVLLVAFFGLKAYGVWFQENKGLEIPEVLQKPVQGDTKPSVSLYEKKIPPESEYDALMSLNLFSPERNEVTLETEKQDEESRKLSVLEQKNVQQYFSNLTLYGLVITNDSAEALVSYPVSKSSLQSKKKLVPKIRKRNIPRISAKESKWIKTGDTLGDFKVMAIKPDRVLLKAGDQSYDLLLYDKENLKKRGPAKPKTGPNVVGVNVKSKSVSQMTGVSAKPKSVSQMTGVSAKPNVAGKMKGRSDNNSFPVGKGVPNAASPPAQKVLKSGAYKRK